MDITGIKQRRDICNQLNMLCTECLTVNSGKPGKCGNCDALQLEAAQRHARCSLP